MDTILQLSHRMAHNSSPSASDVMKFSPTDSLKMSSRDNKRIERRKPNWTESENVFLLDQFAMHREILTCKATDASTNLRKQEIWRLICANLNQNNTLVRRTPAEVRRKWKNLVTAAKKEVWEMRHQMHISGGSGTNGRKISELSQRVLQLHSSGNINNQSNGIYGSLLSAGLLGNAGGGDKFSSKYAEYMEDKSFIPAHFTPIITLSESNNNHIISGNHGDGPPSPMMSDEDEEDQESSDSRNATEFMSDSGVNDQEGMDLRVNVSTRNSYASSNSRSGRNMHNNSSHHLHAVQLHHRESLLSRAGTLPGDLGDEDDDVLEDDEEVELAMEKRYASYNGQLSNGGTITSAGSGGGKHGHGSALANFHHTNNASLTNGPSAAAAAAAASVLLERQHLQHLQQLATAASLRPALNTNNASNINGNGNGGGGRNGDGGGGGSGGGSSSQNQRDHSNASPNLSRKRSQSTEDISPGAEIFNNLRNANNNHFLKLKNHFAAALQENDLLSNLYKERLQLQIEVLKLRREKLSQELNNANQSNGVIRPKIVKCGLRLIRGRNMIGRNNLRPYFLNRSRVGLGTFANRVKSLNNVEKNGSGGGGGGDRGALSDINNVNHSESENELKNDEPEKEVLLSNHRDEKVDSVMKKELEGKCLVNGDASAGGEEAISDAEDES